jgi:hypothetical protein
MYWQVGDRVIHRDKVLDPDRRYEFMTLRGEIQSIEMIGGEMKAHVIFENDTSKILPVSQLRTDPDQPTLFSKPSIGCIPRLRATGEFGGLAFIGIEAESDKQEIPILAVPLTHECYATLYDRLVTVFSGRADRYELASLALLAIGIDTARTKERKSA